MPVLKSSFDALAADKAALLIPTITPLLDAAINAGSTIDVSIPIDIDPALIGYISAALNEQYCAAGWNSVDVGIDGMGNSTYTLR